jgi:hypothetical protein
MAGSTFNLMRRSRRIVLPCVAAMALIVPAAALAAEGAGDFSLPPGAQLPAEYTPGEFSPPPGATLPSESTGQVPTTSNPVPMPAAADGFDLADAGIGAAISAGAVAFLLAGAALLMGRRRRLGASHS